MGTGPIVFTRGELVEGPAVIFTIFDLPVSITVVTTWAIMFLIFVILKLGTKRLKLVPNNLQLVLESIYELIDNLLGQMLGKFKDRYFTFITTMFIFILFSNTISFFPIPLVKMVNGSIEVQYAFRAPTADLNTTVALAFMTTITFLFTNIKHNGLGGYLKGFLSPTPIILPLNIIGEMAKPLNISMRLFGNMFAGSVIIGILYYFTPWAIPSVFHLYFDLISGLVQTFVFVLLTIVYIQGGLPLED